MRTTKEQRSDVGRLKFEALSDLASDLADAVRLLEEHLGICDTGPACVYCEKIRAFLREPQGEVAPEVSPNVMPRVNGKPFRCPCGCNVFGDLGGYRYRCNACEAEYEGEPQPEKETQT